MLQTKYTSECRDAARRPWRYGCRAPAAVRIAVAEYNLLVDDERNISPWRRTERVRFEQTTTTQRKIRSLRGGEAVTSCCCCWLGNQQPHDREKGDLWGCLSLARSWYKVPCGRIKQRKLAGGFAAPMASTMWSQPEESLGVCCKQWPEGVVVVVGVHQSSPLLVAIVIVIEMCILCLSVRFGRRGKLAVRCRCQGQNWWSRRETSGFEWNLIEIDVNLCDEMGWPFSVTAWTVKVGLSELISRRHYSAIRNRSITLRSGHVFDLASNMSITSWPFIMPLNVPGL